MAEQQALPNPQAKVRKIDKRGTLREVCPPGTIPTNQAQRSRCIEARSGCNGHLEIYRRTFASGWSWSVIEAKFWRIEGLILVLVRFHPRKPTIHRDL